MSDFNPTVVEGVESGVNATQEDNAVSEDQVTQAEIDNTVDESNIVEGERSNKGGVNYAEADQKADQAVEESAGIEVGSVDNE